MAGSPYDPRWQDIGGVSNSGAIKGIQTAGGFFDKAMAGIQGIVDRKSENETAMQAMALRGAQDTDSLEEMYQATAGNKWANHGQLNELYTGQKDKLKAMELNAEATAYGKERDATKDDQWLQTFTQSGDQWDKTYQQNEDKWRAANKLGWAQLSQRRQADAAQASRSLGSQLRKPANAHEQAVFEANGAAWAKQFLDTAKAQGSDITQLIPSKDSDVNAVAQALTEKITSESLNLVGVNQVEQQMKDLKQDITNYADNVISQRVLEEYPQLAGKADELSRIFNSPEYLTARQILSSELTNQTLGPLQQVVDIKLGEVKSEVEEAKAAKGVIRENKKLDKTTSGSGFSSPRFINKYYDSLSGFQKAGFLMETGIAKVTGEPSENNWVNADLRERQDLTYQQLAAQNSQDKEKQVVLQYHMNNLANKGSAYNFTYNDAIKANTQILEEFKRIDKLRAKGFNKSVGKEEKGSDELEEYIKGFQEKEGAKNRPNPFPLG